MVVKVSDREISTKEMKNGEVTSIPYGMAVWSTRIGTRPFIKDFMTQIGQINRRAMATDEWLRVNEFQSVMDDIFERYPQVELFLKNKHMRGITDLLEESKGNVEKESIEINIKELKTAALVWTENSQGALAEINRILGFKLSLECLELRSYLSGSRTRHRMNFLKYLKDDVPLHVKYLQAMDEYLCMLGKCQLLVL